MTEVKICGITSDKEADYLIENAADYCGMVMFFSKSKRNIDICTARKIIDRVRGKCKTVAVTVSPTTAQVKQIEDAGFDYIQIHLDLYDDVYDCVNIPVIRAINVKSSIEDLKELSKKKIAAVLFDAGSPGSGKTFNWEMLENINCYGKKVILAGGLNAENVQEAIKQVRPDVVDVSSGVEFTDSMKKGKDPLKIKKFIENVRNV